MNRTKRIICALACAALPTLSFSQVLRPGFDIAEYTECLRISSAMDGLRVDEHFLASSPTAFQRVYASPEVGFDNAWELWERPDHTIAIMLRATVTTMTSWMSNFNAGLVKATGTVNIGKEVRYSFSDDTLAMVHGGWTAGLMYMIDDINAKLDSCLKAGRRDFLVAGHSQGGGLSYLMTAYLRTKLEHGQLPSDVRIKTYCSAAPKPGNYAFALSYEYMTRGGWSFTVVNADDWVPETPLSVQRPSDFNPTNPFDRVDELLGSTNASTRIKVKFLFNKLRKPTEKSVKNIDKYLGAKIGEMLEESRSGFASGGYQDCANYARTGPFVIFWPDSDYHSRRPKKADDMFAHHSYSAYEELAKKYQP